MNFNIFFAKKNKHFKEIFFDTGHNKIKVNTNFNLNRKCNISEVQHQSLKQNGVLVLENALTEYEHNYIGMVCQSCGCVVYNCKISFVNEQNYYQYLEHLYGSESNTY